MYFTVFVVTYFGIICVVFLQYLCRILTLFVLYFTFYGMVPIWCKNLKVFTARSVQFVRYLFIIFPRTVTLQILSFYRPKRLCSGLKCWASSAYLILVYFQFSQFLVTNSKDK